MPSSSLPPPAPVILTQDEIDAPNEEESLLMEKEKIEKLVKEEEVRIFKKTEQEIKKNLSGKYLKCLESF